MVKVRQIVLTVALFGSLGAAAAAWHPQKFFADDPIQAMPPPMSVGEIAPRGGHAGDDFLLQSMLSEPPTPGAAVNTLGDVPDSEWFTNRHHRRRMSREQLQQADSSEGIPVGPFTVTNGKIDGIGRGFQMRDAKGQHFFIKGDPARYPGLASAAEAIVSRFLYAIGYNTPRNTIFDLKLSDLRLADGARIKTSGGHTRRMTWTDIDEFADETPKNPDGSFRVVASLRIEGKIVGSFRYQGSRTDDPNDITPHENRRDLRGLYLVSAWLNNTDVKVGNTLDTVVEENGRRFIRHYLLDFASALGSDGDAPKDARVGNEFMMATPGEAAKQILRSASQQRSGNGWTIPS